MCNLLDAKDAKTILVVLDGLANVLAAAEKMGELEKVSLHIEECQGLDRIENLQNHDNVEIYHKALAILEQYFSTEVSALCTHNMPSCSNDYNHSLFTFLIRSAGQI